MIDFPPGSVGAHGQGCTCEDEDSRDIACPLHGASAEFMRVFALFEEAREEAWEERKERAKTRLRKGAPVALLLLVLPTIVSIAFPMWVAECILWGAILALSLVAWAYRA